MSSYHLNRFLFDLKMDHAHLGRALNNLEDSLSGYDLTAEERDALLSGDPRRLRQLGAHGMLALYLLRLNPEFRTNIYWEQK